MCQLSLFLPSANKRQKFTRLGQNGGFIEYIKFRMNLYKYNKVIAKYNKISTDIDNNIDTLLNPNIESIVIVDDVRLFGHGHSAEIDDSLKSITIDQIVKSFKNKKVIDSSQD